MSGSRWAPVPGFEGRYEVSDAGEVASTIFARRVLKLGHDVDGYPQVVLCAFGRRHTRKVHALVLEAFQGPRPAGLVTRHLDGDPTHNALQNLAWGTHEENAQDRVRHGRDANARKQRGTCGHALSGSNLYRDPSGARHCRKCRTAARKKCAKPSTFRVYVRGEKNAMARLTDEQVTTIRQLASAGAMRQVDIAASFGVSQTTVSQIKRGVARL